MHFHDSASHTRDAPTFIDLFSGAGGLTLGLVRAGMTPLLSVDLWPEAVATYRQNFADHEAVNADIAELRSTALAKMLPTRPDWIVGGPPCQGWSTVGKRQLSDPRNRLFSEFRRVVRDLRPRGFVIENVLGLRDMGVVDAITEAFAGLGYDVSFHVLRAADHGVPQLRRRVLFVGHLDHGRFLGPEPTHAESNYVSVIDAIGDLPEVGPGESATKYDKAPQTAYQRVLRGDETEIQGHVVSAHPPHLVEAISFIPDGGNRRSIPDRLQPKSGFHNSYSRLASWLPAVAVTSNLGKPSATRCIHPFQHRGLTAREGARLQGFPDSFHFTGGIVSQRLQVANAVPPLLAQRIGEAIQDENRWSAYATNHSLFDIAAVA